MLPHARPDNKMTDGGAIEDAWALAPVERELVMLKTRANRLGFAVLLTFFREQGRFPRDEEMVEPQGITALSTQIGMPMPTDGEAFLSGRTAERLRAEIRMHFGFREATVADADMLTLWLCEHVAGEAGGEIESMIERLKLRCRELSIEPPTDDRTERIARTALRVHEERFHGDVYERLSPPAREQLDALLRPDKDEGGDAAQDAALSGPPARLLKLRGSPGRPSLASMQEELAKLSLIRGIALPRDVFDGASPRDLERCRRRVSVEAPHELRRHPDAARITWLAAFVYLRARSLTDDLVDLLIETIHQIGARAERKVERELLDDLKRVTGKQNLLFELADATLAKPDGVVRDVVFPVVGEQTLRDLVREWKATGPSYRTTLRTVGYTQFVSRALPSHGAHPLGCAGVPFQQRTPSPGDASARPGEALRRHQATYLPGRRRRAARWRSSRTVARCRDGEGCQRSGSGQPRDLRNCGAGGAARAASLQGNLGGWREPLPQPGRRSAH